MEEEEEEQEIIIKIIDMCTVICTLQIPKGASGIFFKLLRYT